MPFKIFNGSWVDAQLRIHNGSGWVQPSGGRIHNGSTWVDFLSRYTVDPINWPNISEVGWLVATTNQYTITGPNVPVVIRTNVAITAKSNLSGGAVRVMRNNFTHSVGGLSGGTLDLTFNPGDTIGFYIDFGPANYSVGAGVSGGIGVTNVSDNNALIDNFTFDLFRPGSGPVMDL